MRTLSWVSNRFGHAFLFCRFEEGGSLVGRLISKLILSNDVMEPLVAYFDRRLSFGYAEILPNITQLRILHAGFATSAGRRKSFGF